MLEKGARNPKCEAPPEGWSGPFRLLVPAPLFGPTPHVGIDKSLDGRGDLVHRTGFQPRGLDPAAADRVLCRADWVRVGAAGPYVDRMARPDRHSDRP